MGPDPTVSVIVPCRNEEPFIGVCLECLCSQTYPSALLQIIVVDGRSTDSTRNIVMHYTARDARVRLLSNAQQFVASGLNQAIDVAIGEVIIRVDAHTTVSSDFIEQSVALLRAHPEAWSVGGPVVHVGRGTTGRSIAIAMSHPFGVGNARHRFADSEEEILASARDPEQEYVTKILPDKIRRAKHYVARPSLITDALLIWRTMLITVCCVLSVKYCGIVERR